MDPSTIGVTVSYLDEHIFKLCDFSKSNEIQHVFDYHGNMFLYRHGAYDSEYVSKHKKYVRLKEDGFVLAFSFNFQM